MKQEFVTLPRGVVEQALNALDAGVKISPNSVLHDRLRAALEQPKNHIEQHLGMVPAGWKPVPVVPTTRMVDAARSQSSFPAGVWRAMLDAAPKPPTVKDSLTVEQPQADQPAMTPIAQRKLEDLVASGYTISGYSVYHEQKHQHGFVTGAGLVGWWRPESMEHVQPQGEREPVAKIIGMDEYGPMLLWNRAWTDFPVGTKLYTHPQNLNCKSTRARLATLWGYVKPKPPRQPLTDEQIERAWQFLHDEEGNPPDQHDFARAIIAEYEGTAAPQPPVVEQPQPVETLGETCIDGGTCHHKCTDRCFRRECCAPFSDYSGPWKYEQTQPQGEQEPVAEITGMDEYGPMLGWHKHWAEFPVGTKLHTHPQPKRKPLTDERIDAVADAMPGGLEGFMKGWGWRQFARAVLEATNNIK